MKQIERIFLHSMADLEEISEIANTYRILRASGIIRQFLIDSNSLVNQINREYKQKIIFRVQQRPDITERKDENGKVLHQWFLVTFISPDKNSQNVELLKIQDFLKYNLLSFGEHEFSVLEVIKICANKYGGIHSDDIVDEREKLLDKLNSTVSLLGFDCVVHSMHGIMKVCHEALLPLVEKIKENATADNSGLAQ